MTMIRPRSDVVYGISRGLPSEYRGTTTTKSLVHLDGVHKKLGGRVACQQAFVLHVYCIIKCCNN